MPELISPVLRRGVFSRRDQPVLRAGGDVEIRPWAEQDAPLLVAAYSDPDIRRWHVRTMDREDALRWIADRRERWEGERGADWVVTREETPVGRVALRTVDLEGGRAEVAYWVVPSARGRGLAPLALRTLSDWALETVGFHRLDLHHSVENIGSCRVAEKSGYHLEGTARSSVLHEDGWHDMHLHARINQEPDS